MNYCKSYDILCKCALSEDSLLPCIATQSQCNKERKITKQKTQGGITVINNGLYRELYKNTKEKTPDRTQW